MASSAPQRWLLWQSGFWIAYLGYFWLALAPEREFGWLAVVGGAAMLASYGMLWRGLGVGHTVADAVTLARFVGLVTLGAMAVCDRNISWLLWLGFVLVVAADLVDGSCARRFGGSPAGAVLDMETDQFVTLGLSLVAVVVAGTGPLVLLLPAYKYVQVLAMAVGGRATGDPKPCDGDNRRGRMICAFVMVALLACLVPGVNATIQAVAAVAAVVALGYSFASDAIHLWRTAPVSGP